MTVKISFWRYLFCADELLDAIQKKDAYISRLEKTSDYQDKRFKEMVALKDHWAAQAMTYHLEVIKLNRSVESKSRKIFSLKQRLDASTGEIVSNQDALINAAMLGGFTIKLPNKGDK